MTSFTQYNKHNTKGIAHELLCGIEDQFGFLPNMFSYMVESPVTVQAYLQLNQLTKQCSLTDKQKQLAMLTVSIENKCDFCSNNHKLLAIQHKIETQTIDAVFSGHTINNVQDAALVRMMQALVQKRGFVEHTEIDDFIDAGFTRKQIFECILIVTIKTLSTYANHLNNPKLDPEVIAMLEKEEK